MTLRIKFDKSAPLGVQARVATWCERELNGLVEISGSDELRQFEWATISGGVSVAIVTIILILELQRDRVVAAGERHWDADRLMAVTKDELLRRRILDFQIKDVVGINEPNMAGEDICRVNVINTLSNSEYRVLVSNDGEAYILRMGDTDD